MKRKINIDYLRITACIMVIFLHLSAKYFYKVDVEGNDWSILNVYDSLVRSCVPLFIMISGNLFLSREEEIPLKQLFTKNILKLFVVYIFWSFLYAVDTVGIRNLFQWDQILYYTVHAKYHLWYLPTLIGIYFLYPLFWTIIKYKDGKYFKYACIMFFIFGVLRSTVLETVDSTFISNFSYALGDLSGYFLLGYGLEHYQDKFSKIHTWQLPIIYIVAVIAAALCNWLYGVESGTQTTLFYSYTSVFVFIESCAVFLFFMRLPEINIFERWGRQIAIIAKNTLLVYVLHVFILEHFDSWFNINAMTISPILMIPLLSVVIFIICELVALIIGRIPVLNKWIM